MDYLNERRFDLGVEIVIMKFYFANEVIAVSFLLAGYAEVAEYLWGDA